MTRPPRPGSLRRRRAHAPQRNAARRLGPADRSARPSRAAVLGPARRERPTHPRLRPHLGRRRRGTEDDDGGIGVAIFDGSSDVRLQRLHFTRVRTDAVNTWGAHSDVSIQDSRIEGGGTAEAGVVALGSDRSRDTSVIRTRVRGFTSFGILLQQQEHGRPAADLHGLVLDNVVSDIRDPARDGCWTAAKYRTPGCGTNEGGIWTGGVEAAVIGNTVRRARWDGIETVGSSTRTTIVDNEIYRTRTGIYLEHSTNSSLIARNLIVDALTGINVEWRHEGGGSSRNTFADNRIVARRDRASSWTSAATITASSATSSSAAAARRSSSRGRRTTSCAETARVADAEAAGRVLGGPVRRRQPGRAPKQPRSRERAQALAVLSARPRADPDPVAGGLGTALLVEGRGQRGLLRRRADPGAAARPHGPGHDRVHHGHARWWRRAWPASACRRRRLSSSPAGPKPAAHCSPTSSRS